MRQPVQDLRDICQLGPLRQGWTVYHQNRQAQRPGGIQFGPGACATRILGYNQLRMVTFHQGPVLFNRKRAPRNDHIAFRKRQCVRIVYKPQKIVMLRLGCEVMKMHAANCQEDAAGWTSQSFNRSFNIRYVLPVISVLRDPGRPGQSGQGRCSPRTGIHRISAHLCRKGMSRIDNMADAVLVNVPRQSRCTTKPAHAHRHGLRARVIDTSSVGICSGNALIGNRFCQSIRLGRATKNQEVGHV